MKIRKVSVCLACTGLMALLTAGADAAAVARQGAESGAGPGYVAYVVNEGSNTVTPISTATNTAGKPIKVGQGPSAIAITPNGKTAYVVNGAQSVTPISTATNTPGKPITVGGIPLSVAITPNGETAYVTNSYEGAVTPINTATNTRDMAILDSAPDSRPVAITITPNGQTAYVANQSNTVMPISTATNTALPPITVNGSGLVATAVTPNSQTAYVLAYFSAQPSHGVVTPISTATNTPGKPITVGFDPLAIAITKVP
jgi:YVTN family beta-propeller protein